MNEFKNHLIIFSKNRSCQLHLLLESIEIKSNCLFDKITVLYKAEEDYKKGYFKIKTRFPKVFFVQETSFKQDLLSLIELDYLATTFMVDDAVLYETIHSSKEEILRDVIKHNFIFSLRLGKNCVFSHPANLSYNLGKHEAINEYIYFDYTLQQPGDFNYPLSTDGHIYNTVLLKKLIELTPFNNPNTLEANLQYFVQTNQIPKFLKCFKHSKLVSIPINLTNNVFKNRHGIKYCYSTEELNVKYLDGFIIDFEKLDVSNINGPHEELNFTFKPFL